MATLVCASGRGASVLVGSAAYNFKTFTLSQEEKMNESSNFGSAGFRVYCRGLDGATLNLEGAYDVGAGNAGGAMPFVLGTIYAVTLNVTSSLSYVVNAFFSKADISQDVDGLATLKVTMQVNGSFAAAVL